MKLIKYAEEAIGTTTQTKQKFYQLLLFICEVFPWCYQKAFVYMALNHSGAFCLEKEFYSEHLSQENESGRFPVASAGIDYEFYKRVESLDKSQNLWNTQKSLDFRRCLAELLEKLNWEASRNRYPFYVRLSLILTILLHFQKYYKFYLRTPSSFVTKWKKGC